jgi:hypothetical protein
VSVVIALTVAEFTSRAAIVAALALLALVAIGWRKPARASARSPRGPFGASAPRRSVGSGPADGPVGVPVVRLPAEEHRPPGPLRRLLAAAATGLVAVTSGAVLAVVIGIAAVLAVVGLTDLLGR